MASSSFSAKLCFNSNCKQVLELSRKGWRRRTGEYADLCDRCASAYEEGKFCESFHLNASGWRCCESCGKQIHCGCIVSFHMFVLLDAGGIECINCTRKSFILTPNPAWPPPSLVLPGLPDRIKDISVKNWSSIAASGPVPWRQAPSLFNSEKHPKMPFELDIPSGIDRLLASERLSASSLDKKKNEDSSERLINGSLKTGASQIFEKGIKCEEQPNPYVNATQQPAFVNNEPSTPHFSLTLTPALKTETTEQTKVSKTHAQRPTPPPAAGKQFCSSNGVDSSGEPQTRNGRPRGDARGRNQLLPRYWPRITDQELQQISGDSNSKITPLFEKMLSASDAGRIGRLVLPKKCAEAYFPPISNPEGIPLMVQDLKGKEWVFQFRFWPNNNSRMYVLEGVTPCIQSMQMQAGDRVTFSRLEPEGKLVMGCRKATPSEQCKELINTSNGGSAQGDAIVKATKAGEVVSAYCHSKGNPVASSLLAINQANSADPASTWSKVDKSNYIAREALGAKPALRSKRKYSTLASKSKRLRIENEIIELKVTWEQAQGLFRPPNDVPKIVMIEGYEIEEFEEPPIIGRPAILAEDHVGEKIQWAQCEDCFKWRKVPRDVLFPSIWTCSKNLWDPERSLCSAAEELSPEELKDLLSTGNQAGAKKIEADKEELDSLEALEGLDALAYLAIQEEGDALPSSSLATTKHPRHRPGCSCIVCIQPPSGKGHKHKPTCTCNVCLTVKRRFQTLTLRREKKQSEKEAETARQKLHQPVQLADEEIHPCSDTGTSSPSHKMMISEVHVDNPINMKSSASPFKGQIDLNIQPERDEDLSPVSDSGGMIRRVLQDAAERYFNKLQKISSSAGNTTSAGSQMHPTGVGVGKFSDVIPLDGSKDGDSDHPLTLSATKS